MPFLFLAPFLGVLLSLALAPVYAPQLWQRAMGRIVALWAVPSIALAIWTEGLAAQLGALGHLIFFDFLPFIILLAALYTVAGGLKLRIHVSPTPWRNTVTLAGFTLLAGFLGTTGSAMLGIHPLLLLNEKRRFKVHTVIFFIVLVCNVGGGFSTLGDPPLFMGFLKGVPFLWPTQTLWLPVSVLCISVLGAYYLLDLYFFHKEPEKIQKPVGKPRLAIEGTKQLLLAAGIVLTLLSAPFLCTHFLCLHTHVAQEGFKMAVFLLIIALSLHITPMNWRLAHKWTWHPLWEVGVVFAALFVTAQPIIALLQQGAQGPFAFMHHALETSSGTASPLAYFWITGLLSAILDNTPTYLVFFNVAGGNAATLITEGASLLTAISLGAVLMGALSYIGNAPNLLVRYIAEEEYGVCMPSFLHYSLWACIILLPFFLLVIPYFLS